MLALYFMCNHFLMKIVMDADTIVAAMRSPGGASAELLRRARRGELTLAAAGLDTHQVGIFLATSIARPCRRIGVGGSGQGSNTLSIAGDASRPVFKEFEP